MSYYPVYLNLMGRRCIVIGGGAVAQGKVKTLLTSDALVTVVSPQITQELKKLADEDRITYVARDYRHGDLARAFLVISATGDRTTNEQVWQEAKEQNLLINVVDDLPHCTFIAPAIMRRGDLVIAISTSGKAPALAARLREQLERAIGNEYARFLELAGTVRAPLAKRYPDFEQRKTLWYQLVDSDVLDLLRQRDEAAARHRIAEIMGVVPAD